MSLAELILDTQQQYAQLSQACEKNVRLMEEMEHAVDSVKAALDTAVAGCAKTIDGARTKLQDVESEVNVQLGELSKDWTGHAQTVNEAVKATDLLFQEAVAKTRALRSRIAETVPEIAAKVQELQRSVEVLSTREKELSDSISSSLSSATAQAKKTRTLLETHQRNAAQAVAALISQLQSTQQAHKASLENLGTQIEELVSGVDSQSKNLDHELGDLAKTQLDSLTEDLNADVPETVDKLSERLSSDAGQLKSITTRPAAWVANELPETNKALQCGTENLRNVDKVYRSARSKQILGE